MSFVPGHIYRRRELHETYGGQQQGGISTPARYSFILLFTGDSGEQYGYRDGWQEDGLYYYTGEGQRGDMRMVAGNRAIADHGEAGKDIHLFQQVHRSHVRYIGQFVCSGFHNRTAPGSNGEERQSIVFELVPIEDLANTVDEPEITKLLAGEDPQSALQQLRELALADSADIREASQRLAVSRRRSEAIRQYVLGRARGICEGCNLPAPFLTVNGKPYLEPHHIRRLSDGGPDHPRWVAAVCANCHRRAHYSHDRVTFNESLAEIVGTLEKPEDGSD